MLLLLDYLGTMAFAVSGALKGVRKGLDVFGVSVLATVTAIGGGTIRDAMLNEPVFWFENRDYIILSLAMAAGVFVFFRWVQRTERMLLIFDAIGLGVFTAIGAMKADDAGLGAVGIVTMGLLTGVGGGMIRDVLAGDVPSVLREEIYASAAIAGGAIYWLLTRALDSPVMPAIAVTTLVTTGLRILSILLGWKLPRRGLEDFSQQL